jgi:V8-like Glu-specific endopeptidase
MRWDGYLALNFTTLGSNRKNCMRRLTDWILALVLLGLSHGATESFARSAPPEAMKHAARVAQLQTAQRHRSLRLANVFGNNDRKSISDAAPPNQWVASRVGKLHLPDGTSCTAFLASDDLAVTNAHCVDDDDGSFMQGSYSFCLGYRQGACLARSGVDYVWWGTLAADAGERQWDWAILRLDDALGETFGYFGIRAPRVGDRVSFAGYGKDFFDGQELSIHENCSIRSFYARREKAWMYHDCDLSRGDSGAPIFTCEEMVGCWVLGLHAAEERQGGDQSLYLERYSEPFGNIAVFPRKYLPKLRELTGAHPGN